MEVPVCVLQEPYKLRMGNNQLLLCRIGKSMGERKAHHITYCQIIPLKICKAHATFKKITPPSLKSQR